jgi:hypothetical protein
MPRKRVAKRRVRKVKNPVEQQVGPFDAAIVDREKVDGTKLFQAIIVPLKLTPKDAQGRVYNSHGGISFVRTLFDELPSLEKEAVAYRNGNYGDFKQGIATNIQIGRTVFILLPCIGNRARSGSYKIKNVSQATKQIKSGVLRAVTKLGVQRQNLLSQFAVYFPLQQFAGNPIRKELEDIALGLYQNTKNINAVLSIRGFSLPSEQEVTEKKKKEMEALRAASKIPVQPSLILNAFPLIEYIPIIFNVGRDGGVAYRAAQELLMQPYGTGGLINAFNRFKRIFKPVASSYLQAQLDAYRDKLTEAAGNQAAAGEASQTFLQQMDVIGGGGVNADTINLSIGGINDPIQLQMSCIYFEAPTGTQITIPAKVDDFEPPPFEIDIGANDEDFAEAFRGSTVFPVRFDLFLTQNSFNSVAGPTITTRMSFFGTFFYEVEIPQEELLLNVPHLFDDKEFINQYYLKPFRLIADISNSRRKRQKAEKLGNEDLKYVFYLDNITQIKPLPVIQRNIPTLFQNITYLVASLPVFEDPQAGSYMALEEGKEIKNVPIVATKPVDFLGLVHKGELGVGGFVYLYPTQITDELIKMIASGTITQAQQQKPFLADLGKYVGKGKTKDNTVMIIGYPLQTARFDEDEYAINYSTEEEVPLYEKMAFWTERATKGILYKEGTGTKASAAATELARMRKPLNEGEEIEAVTDFLRPEPKNIMTTQGGRFPPTSWKNKGYGKQVWFYYLPVKDYRNKLSELGTLKTFLLDLVGQVKNPIFLLDTKDLNLTKSDFMQLLPMFKDLADQGWKIVLFNAKGAPNQARTLEVMNWDKTDWKNELDRYDRVPTEDLARMPQFLAEKKEYLEPIIQKEYKLSSKPVKHAAKDIISAMVILGQGENQIVLNYRMLITRLTDPKQKPKIIESTGEPVGPLLGPSKLDLRQNDILSADGALMYDPADKRLSNTVRQKFTFGSIVPPTFDKVRSMVADLIMNKGEMENLGFGYVRSAEEYQKELNEIIPTSARVVKEEGDASVETAKKEIEGFVKYVRKLNNLRKPPKESGWDKIVLPIRSNLDIPSIGRIDIAIQSLFTKLNDLTRQGNAEEIKGVVLTLVPQIQHIFAEYLDKQFQIFSKILPIRTKDKFKQYINSFWMARTGARLDPVSALNAHLKTKTDPTSFIQGFNQALGMFLVLSTINSVVAKGAANIVGRKGSTKLFVGGITAYGEKALTEIYKILDEYNKRRPIQLLIVGNAPGTDQIAQSWARENRIPLQIQPIDYNIEQGGGSTLRNNYIVKVIKPTEWLIFESANSKGRRAITDMRQLLKSANIRGKDITITKYSETPLPASRGEYKPYPRPRVYVFCADLSAYRLDLTGREEIRDKEFEYQDIKDKVDPLWVEIKSYLNMDKMVLNFYSVGFKLKKFGAPSFSKPQQMSKGDAERSFRLQWAQNVASSNSDLSAILRASVDADPNNKAQTRAANRSLIDRFGVLFVKNQYPASKRTRSISLAEYAYDDFMKKAYREVGGYFDPESRQYVIPVNTRDGVQYLNPKNVPPKNGLPGGYIWQRDKTARKNPAVKELLNILGEELTTSSFQHFKANRMVNGEVKSARLVFNVQREFSKLDEQKKLQTKIRADSVLSSNKANRLASGDLAKKYFQLFRRKLEEVNKGKIGILNQIEKDLSKIVRINQPIPLPPGKGYLGIPYFTTEVMNYQEIGAFTPQEAGRLFVQMMAWLSTLYQQVDQTVIVPKNLGQREKNKFFNALDRTKKFLYYHRHRISLIYDFMIGEAIQPQDRKLYYAQKPKNKTFGKGQNQWYPTIGITARNTQAKLLPISQIASQIRKSPKAEHYISEGEEFSLDVKYRREARWVKAQSLEDIQAALDPTLVQIVEARDRVDPHTHLFRLITKKERQENKMVVAYYDLHTAVKYAIRLYISQFYPTIKFPSAIPDVTYQEGLEQFDLEGKSLYDIYGKGK